MTRAAPALALLLLAPFAWAHLPAGTPDPLCAPGGAHDYAAGRTDLSHGWDPRHFERSAQVDGALGNPLCPGGDGHAESGARDVALLFATGDGTSAGSLACHGVAADHAGALHALDATGFGPAFYVSGDHSLFPPALGPDCGDGIIQPCGFGAPPPPSPHPFPVNAVVDTLAALEWSLESSPTCDPFEAQGRAASDPAGPATLSPTFPPGADGAYVVFLVAEGARVPTAGHVWSA